MAGITSISLTWTAPARDGGAPVTGYTARLREKDNSAWTQLQYDPDTHEARFAGLRANTLHQYQVAARNSLGTGSFSPLNEIRTRSPLPTPTPTPTPSADTDIDIDADANASAHRGPLATTEETGGRQPTPMPEPTADCGHAADHHAASNTNPPSRRSPTPKPHSATPSSDSQMKGRQPATRTGDPTPTAADLATVSTTAQPLDSAAGRAHGHTGVPTPTPRPRRWQPTYSCCPCRHHRPTVQPWKPASDRHTAPVNSRTAGAGRPRRPPRHHRPRRSPNRRSSCNHNWSPPSPSGRRCRSSARHCPGCAARWRPPRGHAQAADHADRGPGRHPAVRRSSVQLPAAPQKVGMTDSPVPAAWASPCQLLRPRPPPEIAPKTH